LQLDATVFDEDKVKEQAAFRNVTTGLIANEANWQRIGKEGKNGTMTSSAIAKLFLLGSIKYATRDAYGMGVEYEGGRPGWNGESYLILLLNQQLIMSTCFSPSIDIFF
jgi:hypothetical protein